jgi:2-phosphoglycolate phosphatase
MQSMKPTLIVFDLDGTLVDTFGDIAGAANHALALQGRAPVTVETIIPLVGAGGRNLMIRCMNDPGASEETIDAAFAAWKKYYTEHLCDFSRAYRGVPETLRALRERGIRVAALSNKWHALTVGIAEGLALMPLLDAVQGQVPDRPMKPDPTLLVELMRQFNATPETTWMVGDGDADMLVAQKSGCKSIGVTWGVNSPDALRTYGAGVLIDRMEDILKMVDAA